MKLLRIGKKGNEKPAAIDNDGKIRDISFYIEDLNPDHLNGTAWVRPSQRISLDSNMSLFTLCVSFIFIFLSFNKG